MDVTTAYVQSLDDDELYALSQRNLVASQLREVLVERGKREIFADMAAGVVPDGVSSFAALHDYTDANTYAGLCDEGREVTEDDIPLFNQIQGDLDKWLRAGVTTR